ncbi:MAG: hypothetical protein BWY83_00694 [bacterium ADurb.Bin478]|nr:MAG: hypothetical protein BWY83_00694 [bacterium ADurb.Bin478]
MQPGVVAAIGTGERLQQDAQPICSPGAEGFARSGRTRRFTIIEHSRHQAFGRMHGNQNIRQHGRERTRSGEGRIKRTPHVRLRKAIADRDRFLYGLFAAEGFRHPASVRDLKDHLAGKGCAGVIIFFCSCSFLLVLGTKRLAFRAYMQNSIVQAVGNGVSHQLQIICGNFFEGQGDGLCGFVRFLHNYFDAHGIRVRSGVGREPGKYPGQKDAQAFTGHRTSKLWRLIRCSRLTGYRITIRDTICRD